jgi:hypothetical protein
MIMVNKFTLFSLILLLVSNFLKARVLFSQEQELGHAAIVKFEASLFSFNKNEFIELLEKYRDTSYTPSVGGMIDRFDRIGQIINEDGLTTQAVDVLPLKYYGEKIVEIRIIRLFNQRSFAAATRMIFLKRGESWHITTLDMEINNDIDRLLKFKYAE